MSLNASLLITPFIQFVTGKVIEAGTSGDAAKINARATELIAINTALVQINTGNVAGLPALQAALTSNTALGVGEGLALQSLSAAIANQIALVTSIAGSTLIGQAATDVMDSILAVGTATAQVYIAKNPAPAAA